MKRSEIVWLTVIILTLIVLILLSGIFYFNLVLNSSTTGHVIVQKNPENPSTNLEEKKDIPPVEAEVIYSDIH